MSITSFRYKRTAFVRVAKSERKESVKEREVS
jgi:hypothetical protein